jgi:ribitol 2-dehydrogenase
MESKAKHARDASKSAWITALMVLLELIMAQSLQDKVAIVTGASSGIGRAVARELARNGVRLVLTARSQERLDALANEIPTEVLVAPADMASPREIRSIVERAVGKCGRLDIVLANAGIHLSGDVVDGDPDAWDQLISVNVNGVFRLVHAALPHLIAQHSGDILVTSSISGHQAIHWEPIYSASKHAIQSFVHGLRRQLLTTGVRVGAVAPGIVLTSCGALLILSRLTRRWERGRASVRGCRRSGPVLLTRPQNVTIRDLVMLPRSQDL